MTRTREQVVTWARVQSRRRTTGWRGLCLKFSRMAAGAAGGVRNADLAWARAEFKHTTGTPPRGTFVYWRGGRHGHVAVSAGDGDCYSSDYPVRDRIGWCRIDAIGRAWGYQLRGWSEDINGVRPLDVD
jgi:hypothetical protein